MHTFSNGLRLIKGNTNKIPWTVILLFFWISACQESSTTPIDSYRYFPLELGSFIVYDVKQDVFAAGNSEPVTSAWQEKDQIESSTSNVDNVTDFIVSKYRRNSETDYWQKFDEYSIKSSPDKILTTIDNQTVFSFTFPVESYVKWNGNTYNSLDVENCHYENIDESVSFSGHLFENTVKVVERMDSSVINKHVGVKQYALGVGLVFDEQISFEYCQTEQCLSSDIREIESGYHIVKTFNSVGKNN